MANLQTSPEVTKDNIVTLTNKTLTSPVINAATLTGVQAYGDNAPNIGVKSRAYRATAQTLSNATDTKIQLATESYDVGADFDNATNYRFTAPIAGYYSISAGISFAGNATGARYMLVHINGTYAYIHPLFVAGTDITRAFFSTVQYLAANDYIELWGHQASGGNLNIYEGQYNTFLSVHLISV